MNTVTRTMIATTAHHSRTRARRMLAAAAAAATLALPTLASGTASAHGVAIEVRSTPYGPQWGVHVGARAPVRAVHPTPLVVVPARIAPRRCATRRAVVPVPVVYVAPRAQVRYHRVRAVPVAHR